MRSDPGLPALTDAVAFVVGGSGGIGAAVAARFAAAGAVVVVGHRHGVERAEQVVAAIVGAGGRAVAVAVDVAAPAGALTVCRERFGRLDAVVDGSGIQPVEPLPGMGGAAWSAVLEADATGPFAVVQAAAGALEPGGSVTLVASTQGSTPAVGHAHYASAKAATIMLARAAALEYGPRMRVNTVSPGLVDRPGLAQDWPEGVGRWQAAAPLGTVVDAAAVGDACVFLASPMARWITGHDLVVDGGMSAVPPW